MVYYFTSSIPDPPTTIYVGKDKFENEDLIQHGWEEDFHADNLSSAHVYLRLQEGWEWDKLPAALVDDCAQLTKANSIEGLSFSLFLIPTVKSYPCTPYPERQRAVESGAVVVGDFVYWKKETKGGEWHVGNKKDNVTIIYTPWSNLHKNAGMATGQVGFHDQKKTRRLLVPTRQNAIINRLTKTRTIAPTENLATEKEAHLKALRTVANEAKKKEKKEEERVRREQRDEKWKREHAYEELHKGLGGDEGGDGEEGGGNNAGLEDEEDFM